VRNVEAWFNPASPQKYDASVQNTLENMIAQFSETDWDCDPPQCRFNPISTPF